MNTQHRLPPFWQNVLAGSVGGFCLLVVGHPLDTLKTRIQIQSPNSPFSTSLECLIHTLRGEGIRGLYKGITSPMLGILFQNAVSYSAFGFGKKLFQTSDKDFSILRMSGAGMVAGVASGFVKTPIELTKIRLQMQFHSNATYSGTIHAFTKIIKESGVRGIFKGLSASLARDIPGGAIYFASYEYLCNQCMKFGNLNRNELKSYHYILSGGLAGLCYWIAVLPIDTIKSRFQSLEEGFRYNGIWDCYKKVVSEGYRVLYRGLTPILIRAFPANAAYFFGVETTLKLLKKLIE